MHMPLLPPVETTPRVERNHPAAGANENTYTTPTSDDGTVTEACHAIPSVSENLQKYNKRQIQRAEQARTTYRTLGSLTVANFKHILQQNLIKNCPVTIRDVEIAEDIYGPDIATPKGCTTRR